MTDTLNTDDFEGHLRGAVYCPACWFHETVECTDEHPDGCRVHTEFGDEYGDGDYWLQHRDETEYPVLPER